MMTSCQKLVKNLIAGNLSPSDTLPLASSGGAALTEELRSSRFMSPSETGKRIKRCSAAKGGFPHSLLPVRQRGLYKSGNNCFVNAPLQWSCKYYEKSKHQS